MTGRITLLPAAAILAFFAGDSASLSRVSGGTCGGRPRGWVEPAEGIPHLLPANRVELSARGGLTWNGVAINRERLRAYVREASIQRPPAFTIFAPVPEADCSLVRAVRQGIESTGACARGLCGEGAGRWEHGGFTPALDSPAGRQALRDLEDAADAAAATPQE
jgi:hypothetical protein